MFRLATRSVVNQVRRASSVEIPEGAMAFSFSSPFEQYFDHDVTIKQVDVPTQTGAVGILPIHVPTLGCLAPGVMNVYTAEGACKVADLDKEAATKALAAAQGAANSGDA